MIPIERRFSQFGSALKHGGLMRLCAVLAERKSKGFSQRSLTYSWPKPLRFERAKDRTKLTYYLLPHLLKDFSFAGLKSALDLACEELRRGDRIRFVTFDFSGSKEAFFELYPDRKDLRFFQEKVEVLDVSNFKEIILDLSPEDQVVCTAWWTKASVDNASGVSLSPDKLFYLVQDYEALFYNERDAVEAELSRLAKATYTLGCHYKINSESLGNFLQKHIGLDSHKCASWTVFEPLVSKAFEEKALSPKKKQIFIYARPEVRRNRFDLILDVLKECLTDVPLDWEIYGLGTLQRDWELGGGRVLKALAKMEFPEYVKFASETPVAMSLMESPHPSHPPLEFYNAGAFVVTNLFEEKDLSPLGSRMYCVNLAKPELSQAFSSAIKEARKLWDL